MSLQTQFNLSVLWGLQDAACSVFVYNLDLICGRKCDLVQLWAVSAERLTMVADTARRLPVWGQRVYVGQPWARMLWQQHGHCAVQQDRDWSGQREPAWREAPLTRQHRYFLICPLKHFDIIRPHRATSSLIILTFGTAAKRAKRGKRRRNSEQTSDHGACLKCWDAHLMGGYLPMSRHVTWAVFNYKVTDLTIQSWNTSWLQKLTAVTLFPVSDSKKGQNYVEILQNSYFFKVFKQRYR